MSYNASFPASYDDFNNIFTFLFYRDLVQLRRLYDIPCAYAVVDVSLPTDSKKYSHTFVKILDALQLVSNMQAFKSKKGEGDTLGWTYNSFTEPCDQSAIL